MPAIFAGYCTTIAKKLQTVLTCAYKRCDAPVANICKLSDARWYLVERFIVFAFFLQTVISTEGHKVCNFLQTVLYTERDVEALFAVANICKLSDVRCNLSERFIVFAKK